MVWLPDEAKDLPPPKIFNRNSVWLAGMGWLSAMLYNAMGHRPALKSGVHRQALLITAGWFLGYHLTKKENYVHAKLDRDMEEYVKQHPDEFVPKEKKTYAEIVEPFIPIR